MLAAASAYVPAPKHQLRITREARQAAREAGKQAYQEGRIELDAWHLYKEFLDKCGSRGYCWHAIETLAAMFQRCARELGRWLKQLVDAGLILRERTNRTAHTYIAAFVADPKQSSFFAEGESDPDGTHESDRIKGGTLKGTLNGGGSAAPSVSDSETNDDSDPASGIANEESRIAKLETQTSSAAAPKPDAPRKNYVNPVAAEELRRAGLIEDRTIRELAQRPLDQIRRVVAYVRRQRNAGPGLIAYLLGNNVDVPHEEERHAKQRHAVDRRHTSDAPGDPGETRRPPWADVGPSRVSGGDEPAEDAAERLPDGRIPPWAGVGPSRLV